MRFNLECDNFEEVVEYYKMYAIKMFLEDFELVKIIGLDKYVVAYFKKGKEYFNSIYIYKQYRNQNVYREALKSMTNKIITSSKCNLKSYLNHIKYPHIIFNGMDNDMSYWHISNVYKNDKAKRSGVFFMNHIDEGLAILHWIKASLSAKKAYCLHPIFQSDLFKQYSEKPIIGINYNEVIRAVEYRNVANNYLSTRKINSVDEIQLSLLDDVNDMLIADKIQNYKDFCLYHKETHPRSKELEEYFMNWFERLNITSEMYEKFYNRLTFNDLIIEK